MKKTREQWLNDFANAARPKFKEVGAELPKAIRMSIGFPSKGIRAKTIGECWASDTSTDKHAEIFIRPSLQASASRIADVLTHELIHAALGHEEGHGKQFKRVATALGLTGKMTATVAGPEWYEWAKPILKQIGKFPGAELTGAIAGGKKKQTTRMLKCECDGCGFIFRTTRKNIEAAEALVCPAFGCDGMVMVQE
jgi:hypothetical protein